MTFYLPLVFYMNCFTQKELENEELQQKESPQQDVNYQWSLFIMSLSYLASCFLLTIVLLLCSSIRHVLGVRYNITTRFSAVIPLSNTTIISHIHIYSSSSV